MKILAIESSGLTASVALMEDDKIVAEYTTDYKKTHSVTLLPMLDEIKKTIELDMSTIDAYAVTRGPGSFTGLRIGMSTVKALGMAMNKPVIGVSTLESLATNLYMVDGVICPIMDARRKQVYTAVYKAVNGELEEVVSELAIGIEVLIEEYLQNIEGNIIFLGDALGLYKDLLFEKLGERAKFAPAHLARQRAGSLACLAYKKYNQNKILDARDLKPKYLRMSQAERELKEKNGEI